MSDKVNLEMTYTTYLNLCDAVEKAATHAKDFDEIHELVHLVDFLEDEYRRDSAKQNMDLKTWKLHEELFKNKKIYHHDYFFRVEKVFEDYEDKELLNWDISESVEPPRRVDDGDSQTKKNIFLENFTAPPPRRVLNLF